VAEVARRHEVNANLLFNWCRTARVASTAGGDPPPSLAGAPADAVAAVEAGFIPIGVFGRGADEGAALITRVPPTTQPSPAPAAMTRSEMSGRPGLMEVDLVDGTRLRVDAFVNERALQRVLSALRATS
jgi:transposase